MNEGYEPGNAWRKGCNQGCIIILNPPQWSGARKDGCRKGPINKELCYRPHAKATSHSMSNSSVQVMKSAACGLNLS